MGGRHHPNIDLHGLAPTHWLDHTLLNGPQQLDLHVQGQVANLIQEQGSTVGHLKAAKPVGHGAREGSALVSEEFALY